MKTPLDLLRAKMKEKKIDLYIVPTDDFHLSEYVGEYFQCRKYLTGFTGSAGVAVVTEHQAYLWTDGRYFIQAEKEIKGSGFKLFRMGVKGVPTVSEFIREKAKKGFVIGYDGRTIAASAAETYKEIAASCNGKVVNTVDLVGEIWENRPAMSKEPVWILTKTYAGEKMSKKIERVRDEITKENADVFILTSLCDIAWLFNLRGNDVTHCPVFLSYVVIDKKHVTLYIQKEALTKDVEKYLLKEDVIIRPYEAIYTDIKKTNFHSGKTVLMDKNAVNDRIFSEVSRNHKVVTKKNPTVVMKAIKNKTEIENTIEAHIEDGVAMVKWLTWLSKAIDKEQLTEYEVAMRLDKERAKRPGYVDISFDTIAAYGPNGAMMHYEATENDTAILKKKGFLLVDSGGHYKTGTTDITRTIALGPVTKEEKKWYTLTLKSNINLWTSVFLSGSSGVTLDILARGPLWKEHMDYRCGTGHGVGYLLSVHESPNNFRYRTTVDGYANAMLYPGMITTDEPGVYEEDAFGIRIENELLLVRDIENEYGQWLRFENITMCPIDLTAVDFSLLTKEECDCIDSYHEKVYETLSPYLNAEEKQYLKKATRRIEKWK